MFDLDVLSKFTVHFNALLDVVDRYDSCGTGKFEFSTFVRLTS